MAQTERFLTDFGGVEVTVQKPSGGLWIRKSNLQVALGQHKSASGGLMPLAATPFMPERR